MKRILSLFIIAAVGSAPAILPAQTSTQSTTTTTTKTTTTTAPPGKATAKTARTKQWKIQNAMAAAPLAISKNATIVDSSGDMGVLRAGSNEWTCMPDDPSTQANDPMCLDKNAMEWAKAWKSKQQPNLQGVGIAYMLQGGGTASNSDPFATSPEPGKQWLKEPPHLMIFGAKPDPNVYSTDPNTGKPWIMWAGTPYEHLMVPVK